MLFWGPPPFCCLNSNRNSRLFQRHFINRERAKWLTLLIGLKLAGRSRDFFSFLGCVSFFKQIVWFHTTPAWRISVSYSSDFSSEFLKTSSNEKHEEHRVWSRLQGNVVWKPFVHFVDSVFPFLLNYRPDPESSSPLTANAVLNPLSCTYYITEHVSLPSNILFNHIWPKSSLLKRSTSTTQSQFCFKSSGLWVQSLLQNIVEQNGSITPQSLLYWEMNLRWTGGVSKVSLLICWTGRI